MVALDRQVCLLYHTHMSRRNQGNPRQRILEVAARLFYEQGYQATGINQIIREASVAKASFYHHFPSKEALGLAYVEAHQSSRGISQRQAMAAQTDPKLKLLALFDEAAEFMTQTNFCGCGLLNMIPEFRSPENRIRQRVAELKQAKRQRMQALLQQLYHGRLSAEAVTAKTNLIFLLHEGALMESQVQSDVWPIQEARNAAARLLE